MRLWIDRDHDGLMAAVESFTLAQRGVSQIDLGYLTIPYEDCVDPSGNYHRHQGTFLQRDCGAGHTRVVVDVYFRSLVTP